MTHPLRDPKAGAKRKTKQGEPFDPEDLSRRLTAHLAEEKAKVERRRAAREAKVADGAHFYHHVPLSAASAFERTTTQVDVMKSLPKAARPAVKAHLNALRIEAPATGQVPTLQKTRKIDQAMVERDLLRNRSQFQWNHDLMDANAMDLERDIYKVPQRTFNSDFAHVRGKIPKSGLRPISTGDVFWEEAGELSLVSPKPKSKPLHDRNDRNDWAQRDEVADSRKKEKGSPPLRKKDSYWILLGIKSMKHEKENVLDGSPPDAIKMKGGFLARFKRQPS